MFFIYKLNATPCYRTIRFLLSFITNLKIHSAKRLDNTFDIFVNLLLKWVNYEQRTKILQSNTEFIHRCLS